MFIYCNNNPLRFSDPSGRFPWLIVAILVVCTAAGAVLGATSDQKLGAKAKRDYTSSKTPSKYKNEKSNAPTSNTPEIDSTPELTTKDRVVNGLIGAGLGLAVGGAIVSIAGAVAAVSVGSASVAIPILGGTALQTFARGAVIYDLFAITVAPFFGVEMDTIEYE